MINRLFLFLGEPRNPQEIHVDDVYCTPLDYTVVYWDLFERDYLDTLQLIHGRAINMVAVWDWFDQTWDKLHDRRQNFTVHDSLNAVVSTRWDLGRLGDRFDHFAMDMRKKDALHAYARRNDPPITFKGVL